MLRKFLTQTQVLVSALGVIGFVACGGGSAETAKPATGTGGKVIRTAGGKSVSVEAHNNWVDGLKLFKKNEKAGWKKGACDEVIGKFQIAIEAQRGFAEAYYMIGLTHKRCGKEQEALQFYRKALGENSKLCKARVAIGIEDLKNGSESQGISEFTSAINNDPQCKEAYANLATVQRHKGDNREALNNLRRALAIDAEYLPAFNEMALLYLSEAENNEKKLDLAEVVCSQAQKIQINYAPIYNTWGLIDLKRNKIIEASAKFQKAFQLDPKIYQAYMNFAQITLGFRGYEDAKNALEAALKLKPNSYEALNGLAIAYRGLQQNDKALATYEKALKLDPNRAETYYNLGVLYQDFMNGTPDQLKKAQGYYEQFMSRAGAEPQYASAVEDIKRFCKRKSVKAGKKQRQTTAERCFSGRKQTILETLGALQEMEKMQAEMAETEKKAAAMEAADKAAAEKATAEQKKAGPQASGDKDAPEKAQPAKK